jgi:hypothetical protein
VYPVPSLPLSRLPIFYYFPSLLTSTLVAADMLAIDEGRNDSKVKSNTLMTSSSVTLAIIKMADNRVPEMSDYWKKSTIIEADHQAYHDFDWLTGNLVSTISEVDFPTTHGSTMVCFESHLITGLDLPHSKFLVAIMNFLCCELVHFNPKAITALSCFSMMCEYWLGIPPDTSLCWYFYSPTRYNKVVYSGIELSLHHHRSQEYIDAIFKSSWRGSLPRWFLVDMYVEPQ